MLSLSDLRRPLDPGWKLYAAGDTGTYMSMVFAIAPPRQLEFYVVAEFPNYRYIGGEIELLGESIPEWSRRVMTEYRRFCPTKTRLKAWCDENSQFKEELKHYGIYLRGNRRKLELRVEITREYFQNRRVHLAPWLTILPWELEHAIWPDDTNSAGRFEREKEKDHTLDGIEHICSRRPRNQGLAEPPKQGFVARELAHYKQWREIARQGEDPHTGLY